MDIFWITIIIAILSALFIKPLNHFGKLNPRLTKTIELLLIILTIILILIPVLLLVLT